MNKVDLLATTRTSTKQVGMEVTTHHARHDNEYKSMIQRQRRSRGRVHTLSTCMAFMRSTNPSREVFKISGGVWAGKVSLKCADEYSLHARQNKLQAITTGNHSLTITGRYHRDAQTELAWERKRLSSHKSSLLINIAIVASSGAS